MSLNAPRQGEPERLSDMMARWHEQDWQRVLDAIDARSRPADDDLREGCAHVRAGRPVNTRIVRWLLIHAYRAGIARGDERMYGRG